jgi:hypothetical protein
MSFMETNRKKGSRTKLLVVAVIVVLIVAITVVSYVFYAQKSYWTLNITPTTGANSVTPNGTIQISLIQNGITVTAEPHGIDGFMDWRFDGILLQDNSPTIFITTQQVGSTHTLEAIFAKGTPVITPSASP